MRGWRSAAGRKMEHERQLEKDSNRLAEEDMQQAERAHRDTLIATVLLDRAIQDIRKCAHRSMCPAHSLIACCRYALALETCVIDYHADRMRVINSVLRELWNDVRLSFQVKCRLVLHVSRLQVYVRANGGANDIEYIEIKAEAPSDAQRLSSRKTYNYKLVMYIDGQVPVCPK